VQFDPVTLALVGTPQQAPGSADRGYNRLAFPCAATCRLVYVQPHKLDGARIVSWAGGERTPTVGDFGVGHGISDPAAAITAGGRLWVVWWDNIGFRAVQGDARGAGRTPFMLGRPSGSTTFADIREGRRRESGRDHGRRDRSALRQRRQFALIAVRFRSMRSRPVLLLLLVGLLVGAPVALGGSTRADANSQTFTDSAGEDAQAPDVTSVGVSNDDAGNITFSINISNRPALTPDMFLLIFLDTDSNANTGDVDSLGAEYVIQLVSGAVDLFQWNGSDYVAAASQSSLTFVYGSAGATIHVSAADLNKAKAFNFGVIAVSGVTFDAAGNANFDSIHRDLAPDPGHGFWAYKVLTKLVLTVTAYTTSPKPAKAGRAFSVSLAATENDTAGPVQSGTVTCVATLGGKRVVALRHVVANGVASCVWRIPKTAKGQTIRGTITLVVQSTRLTRPFAARIT
jgi:hypothetical protein